jgi:hypothetical protein
VLVEVRLNPLPPIVTAPPRDASVRKGKATISWLRVSDAAGYRLQLAEDSQFSRIVEDLAITDTSHTPPPLSTGTYFYRLLSRAGDGYEGAWSPTQAFTIVPPPPTPAVEQAAVQKDVIHMRWADLGTGISYQVQVAREPDFGTILTDLTVDLPELDLPRPTEPGTYHVRIRGIDQEGEAGAFTAPQSFQLTDSSPWLFLGSAAGICLLLLAVL